MTINKNMITIYLSIQDFFLNGEGKRMSGERSPFCEKKQIYFVKFNIILRKI